MCRVGRKTLTGNLSYVSQVSAVLLYVCQVIAVLLLCVSGQFLNEVGRHVDGAVSYVTASQLSPDDFELIFNTASALRSHITPLRYDTIRYEMLF